MSGSRKTDLEKKTENNFVKYAQSKRCVCIKGEFFGSCHWPDQLVLLPVEDFFWIEFKREGEEPGPGQFAKHRELAELDHKVYWTDCYEAAVGYLNALL